jgi:hypothetical protein
MNTAIKKPRGRNGGRKALNGPTVAKRIPSELAQIIDEQGTKAVLEILKRELGK